MAGPIPAHTTNLVVTLPLLFLGFRFTSSIYFLRSTILVVTLDTHQLFTFERQLHVVALLLAIDDPRC